MIYLIAIGYDTLGKDEYENIESYKIENKKDISKRNLLESADLTYEEMNYIWKIANKIVNSNIRADKIISDNFGKYRKVAKALKKEIEFLRSPKIKIIQDERIRGINVEDGFYGKKSELFENLDVFQNLNKIEDDCGLFLIQFYSRFKKIVELLKEYKNSLIPVPRELINAFYYYMYNIPINMNVLNPNLYGDDSACVHALDLERRYIYRSIYINNNNDIDGMVSEYDEESYYWSR